MNKLNRLIKLWITLFTMWIQVDGTSQVFGNDFWNRADTSIGYIMTSANGLVGSGSVVEDGFTVITALHVVRDMKVVVYMPWNQNDTFHLNFMDSIPQSDIAIMNSSRQISKFSFKVNPVYNVKPLDSILYIGYNEHYLIDYNLGIVPYSSQIFHTSKSYQSQMPYDQFDFFVLPIDSSKLNIEDYQYYTQPGYSGGPVFNYEGLVIGVLSEACFERPVHRENYRLRVMAYSTIPVINCLKNKSKN